MLHSQLYPITPGFSLFAVEPKAFSKMTKLQSRLVSSHITTPLQSAWRTHTHIHRLLLTFSLSSPTLSSQASTKRVEESRGEGRQADLTSIAMRWLWYSPGVRSSRPIKSLLFTMTFLCALPGRNLSSFPSMQRQDFPGNKNPSGRLTQSQYGRHVCVWAHALTSLFTTVSLSGSTHPNRQTKAG